MKEEVKSKKCTHLHTGVLGDWCELYECKQNFEKCEKCPVGPNAESIKSVKELVKVNEDCRNALERLDKRGKNDQIAKADAFPHYHESVYGDWCELYGCEQVFESCEKCCASDKNVDKEAEKADAAKMFNIDGWHNNNIKSIYEAARKAAKDYASDQTAKADAGKAQLSLVPQRIICAIARIREYGNNKYPEGGKDNWKSVEKQRYVDAMLRHISAYVSDPEGVDEESGFPHLWHAACNLAFILEMEGEE